MQPSARTSATDIRQRLLSGAATLAVIDYKRRETHDPSVGVGIEQWIIDRELRELEGSSQPDRNLRPDIRRRSKSHVLLVKTRWLLRRASLKKFASS